MLRSNMASLPRFFIPPDRWNLANLALEAEEAHHCVSVMRRKTGDEIIAFDGQGHWAHARLASEVSSRLATLEILHSGTTTSPEVSLSLLQAIPKGSNMELIIEKAVELGVQHIHPVITAHTVVKLAGAEAAKKQVKWQRVALEACKQCGQNWQPIVHTPVTYDSVWEKLPPYDLKLVAAIQNDAVSLKKAVTSLQQPARTALIAIGPEGDFSDKEYQRARQFGCQPITLGPIILRVETAAMFCLSVLTHELAHQRSHV